MTDSDWLTSLIDGHDPIQCALKFWRDQYANGVRITLIDGAYRLEQVDGLARTTIHKRFGYFPVGARIEPNDSILAGIAQHNDGLRRLLIQPIPAGLDDWFFHLLTFDYEFVPLAYHLECQGIAVDRLMVDGGNFPMITGKRCDPPKKDYRRSMAQILIDNGYRQANI